MSKFAKMKLLNEAEISKAIGGIERRHAKLQDDVHRIACSIMSIWQYKTGPKAAKDTLITAAWAAQQLTRLGDAVPYHRNAFFLWVVNFTDLVWDRKAKQFIATQDTSKFMGARYVEARALPFWEFKRAPKAHPLIMSETLQEIIDKLTTRAAKPREGDDINTQALAELREIQNKYFSNAS